MKNYKLTYLLGDSLSEEQIKNFQEKIQSLIQKEGSIESVSEPIKKNLGYKIKNENYCHLINIDFSMDEKKIEFFKKSLDLDNKILRYIILNKKPSKNFKGTKKRIPKIFFSKTSPKIGKPKKVELKEIDKKLEEILKE